jgi:hypothetical protein
MGLLAASALVLALTPVGGARAAEPGTAAQSTCVIDGYTPGKVVVGTAPVKLKFAVNVHGCTVAQWVVVAGPIAAFNGQETVTLAPRSLSNADAGKIPALVAALGADEDENDPNAGSTQETTFSLLRRATWGRSVNAGPEPVKAGAKLSIKGTLGRVNWNGAKKITYVGYGARKVQVQFRAAGSTSWVTIKSVLTGQTGKVATTVPAVKTGAWRIHFSGNAVTSPADSTADNILVK